jgi:hypothetical protein
MEIISHACGEDEKPHIFTKYRACFSSISFALENLSCDWVQMSASISDRNVIDDSEHYIPRI